MSIPKTSAWNWKIYLGSNLIAEGGCWLWKPWTNTVLYCPFSTDMVNKVDNTAPVSQSGASISNWYLSVSNWYVQYTTSKYVWWSQPRTFNTWLYMYSINTWNRRVICSWNGHFMTLRITWTQRQSYQWIPQRTIMSQWDTDSRWVNNWFRIPLNEWHNLCIIYDWTKVIQYYDTQKLEVWISIDWDTSSQTNSLSIWENNSYDRFDWRQSELIVENGNWTEDEIVSYYNQTKANY